MPRCATGAGGQVDPIPLQERPATLKERLKVRAVAADVDGMAIEHARVCADPAGIVADLASDPRAEAALRASEERYQALFERSLNLIYIHDLEGRFVDANDAALKRLGYTRADISSLNFAALLSADQLPLAFQTLQEILATGVQRDVTEFRLRHKDGHDVYVETQGSVILANGAPVAIQSVARDITDRRRAEAALKASEARHRILFASSHDALMTLAPPSWRFTAGNASTIAMFGAQDEADFVSRAPWEYSPERQPDGRASADAAKAMIETAMRDGSHFFEWTHQRLSGEVFPVTVLLTRMEIAGQPLLQATVRDITASQRAEEAVRQSSARWQATFDSITDMVTVLSPGHEFLEINAAGCQALGLPREQILGRKCYELVHGRSSPIAGCPCGESLATRAPATREHSEHGRTFSLAAWPTLDRDGQLASFVHTVRDITAARKGEAERAQLEAQLLQSRKMEAIGRLAGGVAHDFNNLLSVILSYTGFALEDLREGDPLKDDLVQVKNAGERAAALTRQLLAFSRKQVLQPVPLNLNEIARNFEKMLRRILGEDIDFVQVLAPGLGVVRADPGQIEQVLMNLVVNARDAMPAGGKLTIETANVELDEEYASCHVGARPGPHVMVAVTDSGVGMDEPTKAALFEPFFTTKEQGKGTGLGLATVYGIVAQSGGTIWVYSEPGQGTTFKVYLPRDPSLAAPVDKAPPTMTRTAGTETVLVVEDDDAVRHVAKRILDAAGYTVLTAANGGEALLACEQHPVAIQLVLTDVVMPQMSGRVLVDRLAQVRPDVKVLYMSGYTDDAIVHHGVLDAGTQFINKPFSQVELLRKVRAVLDGDCLHGRAPEPARAER